MDFETYLRYLQGLIDYRFKNPDLLALALTAAGAEGGDSKGNKEERKKYDGNRPLAQLGDKIAQVIIISKILYEDDNPDRDLADKALKSAKLKDHMEKRARVFQLDKHMKLNIRQKGDAKRKTLSTVINAIFGACFLDSDDMAVVRSVIDQFGLGVDDEHYKDPIAKRNQQYIFGGEVTEGIFDGEPSLMSNDIISNSPPSDVNIIQTIDWEPNLHPLKGIEDACSQNSQEEYEIFGTLPSRPVPIIREGIGENINDNLPLEFDWEDPSSPLFQLEEPDSSSGATSSSSQTIIGSDEQHTADVQSTQGIDVYEAIPVMGDSARPHIMQGSAGQIERQSPGERLSRLSHGGGPTKRKSDSATKSKAAQLDVYVSTQKAHCRERGLPCPEESFKEFVSSSSTSGRFRDMIPELKILYFGIASPESIAALQVYINVGKRDISGGQKLPEWDLSLPKRMLAIEELDKKISYVALIRRCHIHKLYIDSSGKSRKTSDGFVLNTPESISMQSNSELGNPHNIEDSRVSEMILRDMCPKLDRKSNEYRAKLQYAKKIRKLGQRLDRFVRMWGYGILGLLPLAKDIWDDAGGLEITDSLILKFTDPVFEDFVQRFNHSQGIFLRKWSDAVSKIVEAIAQGRIHPSVRFDIEDLDREQILNEPRGSSAILNSISRHTSHL